MATDETSEENRLGCLPGKVIINFLNDAKDGATLSEIVRHLKTNYQNNKDEAELNRSVERILNCGAELGFLERKGSQYLSGRGCRRRRRRRSCSCRRRRRRIRRCSRRRRRRRCR